MSDEEAEGDESADLALWVPPAPTGPELASRAVYTLACVLLFTASLLTTVAIFRTMRASWRQLKRGTRRRFR